MRQESSTLAQQLSVSGTKAAERTRVGRQQTSGSPSPSPTPPPVILFLAVQKGLFRFASLVVLDVVCGHLMFFY